MPRGSNERPELPHEPREPAAKETTFPPSITVTELSRPSWTLTSLCGCFCLKYFSASIAASFRSRNVRDLPHFYFEACADVLLNHPSYSSDGGFFACRKASCTFFLSVLRQQHTKRCGLLIRSSF